MQFTFKRALGAGVLAFSVATVFSLQAEEKAQEQQAAATDCEPALTGESTDVAMRMGGAGMGGNAMGGGGAMSGGNMAGGGAMSGGNMAGGGGNMSGGGAMTGGRMQRVDASDATAEETVQPAAVDTPKVEGEDAKAAMLAKTDSSNCNPKKAEADVN